MQGTMRGTSLTTCHVRSTAAGTVKRFSILIATPAPFGFLDGTHFSKGSPLGPCIRAVHDMTLGDTANHANQTPADARGPVLDGSLHGERLRRQYGGFLRP